MATFTWSADYGASVDLQPRVKQVSFGDGYEQRVADGINTLRQMWQLNFSNRTLTEINAIDTFLRARGGIEAFDWTPPRASVAGKFVCRSWQRTAVAGVIDSISAKFEQVFEV